MGRDSAGLNAPPRDELEGLMSERAPAGHLRVGIIGTGRISDLHALGYLAHPHTSIVAVCDLDLSAAQAHAVAWGVPPRRVYADYHELLTLGDVDAVEILLPHHLHQQVA